jgi:hypothetical protein
LVALDMPTYFFGVNNDRPDPATGEELPHDQAAHEWAMGVTRDLNRNRRHPENMVRVKAYRRNGSVVEN